VEPIPAKAATDVLPPDVWLYKKMKRLGIE